MRRVRHGTRLARSAKGFPESWHTKLIDAPSGTGTEVLSLGRAAAAPPNVSRKSVSKAASQGPWSRGPGAR